MAARNQDAKGRAVESQTEAIPANDHTAVGSVYPKVDMTDGTNSFPAMESIVQDYWNRDQTFQASLDQRKDAPEYIFMMVLRLPMVYRITGTCSPAM